MPITVNCFATLAQYAPAGGALDLPPDGLTVDQLLARLGIDADKVAMCFVNGLNAPLDKPLKDGDRVGLFPAVAGG
uniref:MoaD/ThiS family protein n=1 Tax=Fundidesulfovibrio putealis TaxID=270496 RepID=A0A7C3WCJ3_9BACT